MPWNERHLTHEHAAWFAKLTQVHELTTGWISGLEMEQAPYLMARGLGAEITQNLGLLKFVELGARSLGDGLESLLDDTRPEDVLGRLDTLVWAVHAFTAGRLLARAPAKNADERAALMAILEQVSWKLGKNNAELRWSGLSAEVRGDLRSLIPASADTPFSGARPGSPLVRRLLRDEAQLELTDCPHQSRHAEVRAQADLLCQLHGHWLKGFAYGLNSRVSLAVSARAHRRCLQIWTLHGTFLPESLTTSA